MDLSTVIATDLERCRVLAERHEGGSGLLSTARALLFYPGFYGVVAYRVSHAALHASAPTPLRLALYALALLMQRAVITMTKVEISAQAHIGPGLLVNHAQGVVVGPIVAGANLTLSHFASLGLGGNAAHGAGTDPELTSTSTRSAVGRCPELGDRVWIGIGAVVGGQITLGDDVMVGANSVVSHDLANRSVAAGSPAAVLSQRGSFDFVHYRGMLDDPSRIRSLGSASRLPEQRRAPSAAGVPAQEHDHQA